MSPQLAQLRNEIDQFLRDYPESPLSSDQRSEFEGLNYYDGSADLVFELPLEFFDKKEPHIEMATSTGDVRHFRRLARFDFEVNGETAALTIYSDPWGQDLFLPFKDATNGSETYGAGRYLDSHRPGLVIRGDHVFIDFNFAYNPYCAYNEAYSCPLPPRENWVTVPIRAGELQFP
ncbi:MAG: DUF1684 domain-containing protein [Chloroflexota bacterium]